MLFSRKTPDQSLRTLSPEPFTLQSKYDVPTVWRAAQSKQVPPMVLQGKSLDESTEVTYLEGDDAEQAWAAALAGDLTL